LNSLLLFQFVGQVGRFQHGQHLAFLDGVAGVHLQFDRGGGSRIQGWADGSHDAAVDGGVADQGAARDFADAQPCGADRLLAAAPAFQQAVAGAGQRQADDQQQHFAAREAAGGGGDHLVLV